jgi:hypothetical protein
MATKPISNFTASWNQNQIYNGIGMNAVDTAANVQSKLINLYHNSVSKFSVDKSGNLNTNAITASSAKIGNFPSGKQRTFADQSTSDILANKIRSFSASISYLEMMTGSNSFINAPKLPGPGITDWNNSIRFSDKTPDDNTGPSVRIRAEATQAGNTIGSVNIYGGELVQIAGGTDTVVGYTNTGPGNTPNAVEINDDNGNTNNSSVTISSPNIRLKPTTNECVKIDGCLEVSGAIWTKGEQLRIGSQSLYLSSSNTESRIYGTNLKISASLVTASRMHIGGPTQTSQYNFYDGSKPDLYVNKLRAYSGSFTSVEIISGSNASMSIKNNKGNVIFESTVINNTESLTLIGDQLGIYAKGDKFAGQWFPKNPLFPARNTIIMSGSDFRMNNVTASLTGAFDFKGKANLLLRAGEGDFTGNLNINALSGGVPIGLQISNTRIRLDNITTNTVNNRYTSSFDIKLTKGGETKYENTHSIKVGNGKVTIDGDTTTVSADKGFGQIFFDFAQSKLKFGTQSLYITGSLISGSEFRIYAPDSGSSANIFYVTASKGTFTQLSSSRMSINTLTASNIITASSAGASSGKYAKIKIGDKTYKLLLYEDV